MMEHREEILFRELKERTSCFKFVPDNIGEIIYCDSTNPKCEADTKEQIRKKIILSIAIPLAIAGLDWVLFYTSPIMSSIVSIAMLLISRYCVKKTLNFKGTDFFVGTEGYALVDFDKTRDNITKKVNYHFDNFSDLVIGETIQYKDPIVVLFIRVFKGWYECTNYYFQFWSKEEDEKKHMEVSIESSYEQEKPGDYYEDTFFRFYKTVEDSWSKYKFDELKKTFGKTISSVGFTLYGKENYYSDYIVFDTNGMQIGNTRYDRNSVKNLCFDNGCLIVEHVNHTSKLFGLIQKGDKDQIPLNMIGNRKIFLTFLEYFTQTLNND